MPDPQVMVDTPSLDRLDSGSIVGGIWIVVEDIEFPERDWLDFPVVLLSWWLEAVEDRERNAAAGAKTRFAFMDGPWEMSLAPSGQQYHAEFYRTHPFHLEHATEISFEPLAGSVRTAAAVVLNYCESQNWSSADISRLRAQLSSG